MTETIKTEVDTIRAYLLELGYENVGKTAECYYSEEARDVMEKGIFDEESDRDEDGNIIIVAQTPCCIVGRATFDFRGVEGLRKLVEDESVSAYNEKALAAINGSRTGSNTKALQALGFSDEAIMLMSRAQFWQDQGLGWDAATQKAVNGDELVNRFGEGME